MKSLTPPLTPLAIGRQWAYASHKSFMGEKTERSSSVLQGTLDMLVLKTLARGPLHGYDVAEHILAWSGDILRVEEGALYPALHRLELRGLLASEWGVSANNRRAKYYRLTAAGRKQLAAESSEWARLSRATARVMEA
jgi:transcriptional regulator